MQTNSFAPLIVILGLGVAVTAACGLGYPGVKAADSECLNDYQGSGLLNTESSDWRDLAEAAELKYRLPAKSIEALIHNESGGRSNAISYVKGKPCAYGLTQMTPGTARRYGLLTKADLLNPVKNVDAGAHHYKDLLEANRQQAIAHTYSDYNAGSAAPKDKKGIAIYRETQAYVMRNLAYINRAQ